MVSSTVTLPPVEMSLTVPPAPEKPKSPLALFPVVAVMSALALAVIFPPALTINVPPSPPEAGPPLLKLPASAPLKLAKAIPVAESKVMVVAFMVSLPPEERPSIPSNWFPL